MGRAAADARTPWTRVLLGVAVIGPALCIGGAPPVVVPAFCLVVAALWLRLCSRSAQPLPVPWIAGLGGLVAVVIVVQWAPIPGARQALAPDLAARVEDVRAQEARAREAEADLYPELYAQGAYGLDAWWYQFSAPPTVRSNTPVWNAGLGLRWSFFEGFERLNAIREAEAEAAAARASLEEAELEAVAAVWRAYHDQRAAAKKYEYANALLAASREAYQSNLESYHRGLATIVDLLTAEGDLAESRYLVVQSRADLLTQAARIAYVAGTVRSSPAPLP